MPKYQFLFLNMVTLEAFMGQHRIVNHREFLIFMFFYKYLTIQNQQFSDYFDNLTINSMVLGHDEQSQFYEYAKCHRLTDEKVDMLIFIIFFNFEQYSRKVHLFTYTTLQALIFLEFLLYRTIALYSGA